MLTPEEWARVKAVFGEAFDKPDDERRAFVSDACGGDEALADEVLRLLDLEGDEPGFLDPPPSALVSDRGEAADPVVGQQIDAYRVIRRIASGGMGTVYEAEQDNPRRRVALKLLRPDVTSRSILRRFEYEAQLLGRLRHPGIAQIHDAGSCVIQGHERPYFVMELIDGQPLMHAVRDQAMGSHARLELLVRICDAVQHAHHRGVIHRDLKPANILVDRDGEPKVLDFGVARATDARQATTMHTVVGEIIGTLRYMSPEQVAGDPEAIDTRTDVYALGMLAYEMLTGEYPYSIHGQTITEVSRAIEDQPPAPLSAVDRVFRGDIETIVAKALEKSPADRYASPAEMAADIQRYLAGETITARAATTVDQVIRFARSHRSLVAIITVIFLLLTSGMLLFAWQYSRAEAKTRQVEAVNDFLAGIFQSADPMHAGADVMAIDLINDAAARVDAAFADQPIAEAAVRNEIGTFYYNLGDYTAALDQFSRSLDLRREHLGSDDLDTLRSMNNTGLAHASLGNNAAAESLYRETLRHREATLGPSDPETLVTLNNLGTLLMSRDPGEAARVLATVHVRQASVLGELHRDTITSYTNFASAQRAAGDIDLALMNHEFAMEDAIEAFGMYDATTGFTISNYARTLRAAGRSTEASDFYDDAIDVLKETLGASHVHTLTAIYNNGLALYDIELYDLALAEFTRARDGFQEQHGNAETTLAAASALGRTLARLDRHDEAELALHALVDALIVEVGPTDPRTLNAMGRLADQIHLSGREAESGGLWKQVAEGRAATLGADHIDTLDAINAWLNQLQRADRHIDAVPHYEDLVERGRRAHPEAWKPHLYESRFGRCLQRLDRFEEAEQLLMDSLRGYIRVLELTHRRVATARRHLANLYDAWGKPDQAAMYRD